MVPIYTLIWKASSTSPLLTMWLAGYHHLSLLPMEWVVYTEHGKEKRFHSTFGMEKVCSFARKMTSLQEGEIA